MEPLVIEPTVVTANGMGPGFFNLSNLLMPQNVALIVVAWSLTELVSRSSKGFEFVQARLLPILPLIFCVFFVFATASWQPDATHGERLLLGALLGTVTVWGHMAAQQTGLHKLLPFMNTDQKNTAEPKKDA